MEIDKERKRKLGVTVNEIHRLIPTLDVDTCVVGSYEIRKGYMEEKSIKRLIIYLRSSGCQWMLNDINGGCFMCGHLAGTTMGEQLSSEEFITQFDKIISEIDFSDIPMICIYNAGSFFNDNELPSEARIHIYKALNKIDKIKYVIFESRPEYISEDELAVVSRIIKNKHIEVGIGLESSNEYVREICLNKGFKKDAFLRVIKLLKKYNIKSLVYILLKPPFLSEQMSIDDTVQSIDWAFQQGADAVSLEPVSVQNNTLVHLLYSLGMYRSPWIWSVLKVISLTHQLGLIRIGGFEFFPLPKICTHNCTVCDEMCINAIELYNTTNDISVINDAFNRGCKNCKNEWYEELLESTTIEENIDKFLQECSYKNIERCLCKFEKQEV